MLQRHEGKEEMSNEELSELRRVYAERAHLQVLLSVAQHMQVMASPDYISGHNQVVPAVPAGRGKRGK